MRSRFTPQTLSGLAARGTRHRARRVGQVKLGGAFVTKPDQYVWSVRPEERTDSSGHLHRVVHAESLQSLNVKRAVVKLAFSSFVAVNTLPLPKHRSRHDESPYFLRITRKYETVYKERRGFVIKV